ncbi:hypothetical protein ASG60_07010 [Methylobacterium sp. Leaf469]|jgi:ribosome modulation factor|uniref:ribosome modulation factor n=1 Tax=unclassified Methylobacterium TaxID=2615210 RepID=UPI0006F30D0A|nr:MULTISPECIES: Rmf/CrpP family protein [unclassified Methylobacterium]USU30868.1 ribosome modulation factor [Methylobacterium sp. OTU13CASTA1]KQO71344.1 hypothetical protein ASF22_15595 [Methylobacterium sp. Leaf87]KQP24100.1 hypothetical protein ASF25_08255 [Methylobacterium sp. Leaf100]KQP24572.1 hypothetical protein ASF27_10760 [Methylobacterium sp. Leaf102]KQP60362.1 hypothetical protein ASF52_08490 [Methylobacterium sp. Leaf112]
MSYGATASDSPFIKGRNARLNGRSREACPYTEGTADYVAWMQAFDEAATDDTGTESGTIDPQKAAE